MWPSIFGSGWGWGVLVALAFLCLVFGVLGFLFAVVKSSEESAGPLDRLWHRFEEGDLTQAEFVRLTRTRVSRG